MKAKDVMTTSVVTVRPDATVTDIAKTLLERRISAVPVLDERDRLVGIVSEGDLIRRAEFGTARPSSWWLAFFTLGEGDARRFVKTHGRHARDVMTKNVATVDEETSLQRIADILESRRIKRLPVLRDHKLVGIVSRADLLRGFATVTIASAPSPDDLSLREAVEAAIRKHAGLESQFVGVTVQDGVADLWGGVLTQEAKDAARVAAENVPGVRSVRDRTTLFPREIGNAMWAE